jgi:biotin operon repressor
MTQEALAEMLGVSVDAIGKYERSVSFIRGDLEPRLSDALGWSREDILACREDWEIRQHARHGRGYRLLDQSVLDEAFGGSLEAAIVSGLDMADAVVRGVARGFCPFEGDICSDVYGRPGSLGDGS